MNYLVTGGAGFIGSNYVRHLIQSKHDANIIVLNVLTYAGNPENLSGYLRDTNILMPNHHQDLTTVSYDLLNNLRSAPSFGDRLARWSKKLASRSPFLTNVDSLADDVSSRLDTPRGSCTLIFVVGSVTDGAIVERLMRFADSVVNFAAETHGDRSINDPGDFLRSDVIGMHVLLEAARKCPRLQKFVQISTDEVYGSATDGAFSEDGALNPTSPYSASKASADLLAFAYLRTYRVPVIVLGPTINFGSYQYPEKLIPLMIVRALADKTLPLYGDGMQRRTWLHVGDTALAIDLPLSAGEIGEIYNLSGQCELRNMDLVMRIIEKLGKTGELIRHVADRPAHDRRYAVDDRKIRDLGICHAGSFDQHLEMTIDWYTNNREWWLRILNDDADYRGFMDAWYEKHS
jgi:dTDP-glucose 4,6-dehydratase